MNLLKKIVIGFCATAAFSFGVHAETWVVNTEKAFPPYNFVQDGKLTGLDTEIVELVLNELSIDPNYEFKAWEGVVESVDNNTTDLAFQFAPTPDRFKKYNMVGPHRTGKTVIAVPADSANTIKSVSDLSGKTVATVKGYTYLDEFDNNSDIKKLETSSNTESLKKLANKDVEFMIGDLNTIAYLSKENGLDNKIKVLPITLKQVPRYIAFPKEKIDDAKRFEAKLQELMANGKVEAIIQKWSVGS